MKRMQNPLATVREMAAHEPSRPALIYDDAVTTYGQLAAQACSVANGLIAAQMPPQSRIALLDFNDPTYPEILLGCHIAGHTLCPINARLAAAEVAWILDDSKAPIVFVGRDHYRMIESIESQFTHVQIIALHGGHARWPHYAKWRDSHPVVDPKRTPNIDDDVIQLYTSGTTGHPKGVRHTHRAWAAAATAFGMANPSAFAPDCVNLICLPLFHVAGFNPLCYTLMGGGRVVLARRLDPADILALMQRYAVTNTLLVPALIIAVLNSQTTPARVASMRSFGYGASPIAPDVLQRARELFACPFEHYYGMTENLGVATSLPPAMHDASSGKLTSCGRPYADCEVKVVDERGAEKPAGEVGEIVMKSAWLMRGYWNQPEATAATIRDGWLWTGDAGYFDADGYLYIHDRMKDMIKTGGENVFPAEVENVLFGHPSIADCAVIGVPDEHWGEAVKAVIVLRPGAALDQVSIERHLRANIGGYKIPRSYEVVAALPRNASGKILRRHLREQFSKRS
jgi:acyl-CoA synthetase (AMP-forming)/AMP-acid ligase II